MVGVLTMVFDGILISFIIGFLRKGKLDGLINLRFKYGWIFPILLAVQIVIFSLQDNFLFLQEKSGYVFIIVYILGLCFLWLNRDLKGMNLIIIGVALNFIVMLVNGGRMPVSVEAAVVLDPVYVQYLKEGLYAKHTALTEDSFLGFLGDIIPLTSPYPRSQVISIGDILMNIGVFIFIQHLMMQGKTVEVTKPAIEGG